jgi:Protein of unknown function (DUF2934)
MRLAMDTLEDRIRRRAYERWEAAGQTGSPEDHWLAAERELQSSQDHPEANFDDVPRGAMAGLEAVAQGTDRKDQEPSAMAET